MDGDGYPTLDSAEIETRSILADDGVFTTLAFVTLDGTGNREFSFARKPGADTQLRFEDLDLSLADMLEMLTELHAEHPDWGALDATAGRNQLLWLTGELGEVIDVVKKNDPAHLSQPGYAGDCLTEEIADVMMYLNDVLLCYDIAPEEISRAYYKKHLYNLRRNYRQQNEDRYGK